MSGHNRTRQAIFEFDKLVRSLYTLRFLLDPQLHRDVHRSQNRIESYHQLRAFIAQISGNKELIGHTELEVAISSECCRLLANVVIAYNSMLLSTLLGRYLAAGNAKALERFKRMSPVAWRHIHFLGHYLFKDQQHPIDLEALLAGVELV